MATDTNLDHVSPLAWVVSNHFLNEQQEPLEFSDHRFLIQPFSDLHPDQVIKKSAQVGFSVTAILKSLWLAKYYGLNIIYALPTNDIIKGFVQPKVDTLIDSNPKIRKLVTTDSVSLKQVGERFIHFKGTGSQREAISTSADLLIVDEHDRALDMGVVTTFDSRLQASKFSWRWRFSNPAGIGFGTDMLYEDSDQMHWFVTCSHCGYTSYLDWSQDNAYAPLPHFVNRTKSIYQCGNAECGKEISDNDRRNGKWLPRFPERKRRGYWISQLMVPTIPASRIIEQYEDSNIEHFHNFVLGKAYTPQDLIVNRATILRACAPSLIPKLGVAMGVDQNANEQIWVAGTSQGIFAHGKTTSWEDLERLKLTWNATVVLDPAPYPTKPKILSDKYNDMYLCYFKDTNAMQILEWKGQRVFADRTRLLDTVATEIAEAKLLFREHPHALEDYIADWQNLYRTTVEEPDGRTVSKWLKKANQESDYSLATAYYRIALSRVLAGSNSTFYEPSALPSSPTTDTIGPDGRYRTTLTDSVRETLEGL